jgi:nitrite reductase/ring-hydroxylating ferredoxin subunit
MRVESGEQAASPPARTTGKPQPREPGRQDWSSWPHYQNADKGFRGYWYPVVFSSRITGRPTQVTLLGEKIMLIRDGGDVYALKDRCPHRGVPLSQGRQQFPGTVSCPYHGWTFDLASGELKAAITDGPASPICGKVTQPTYPVAERLGMVWIYVGDGEQAPPIDEQLPEELVGNAAVVGARRQLAFRLRERLRRGAREVPAPHLALAGFQVDAGVERDPDRAARTLDLPGAGGAVLGRGLPRARQVEHPGLVQAAPAEGRDEHREHRLAPRGQPGDRGAGVPRLRVGEHAYEFYVPIDADNHLYVGVMANFSRGIKTLPFYVKYLGAVRWLFHGQFSAQDKWMVEVTDAPPEKLYRPDDSLLKWRKLAEDTCEQRAAGPSEGAES